MTNLVLPDSELHRRLTFYLSMEEFAACHLSEIAPEGAFFIWQVEPTVICGRNQDIGAEVDLPYCAEHGIDVCRRKSGGGCVYADRGNIMISYIKHCTDISGLFSEFLERLACFLHHCGIPAEVSGRNDILVQGRKVSGNAFALRPGGVGVVHGTLLYDLDFEILSRALTPSKAKLESKGVKSVSQRVGNLKTLLAGTDLEQLKTTLVNWFCDDCKVMEQSWLKEVAEIEKEYTEPSFIAGHSGDGSDGL